MTRDEIIKLARSVGYPLTEYEGQPYIPPLLGNLLKGAVAAEREECAKVCERLRDESLRTASWLADECSAAIRARGQA